MNNINLSDTYKKVYSYYRFSTSSQEHGDSIRRQTENCLAFCNKYNLTLSEISFSDLGVSGHSGKHLDKDAGLGSFIAAIEKENNQLFPREKTLLLIDDWSRLSRLKPMVAQSLISRIIAAGVHICTVTNEMFLTSDSEIHEVLLAVVQLNSAYSESARKSQHLSAVWKVKKQSVRDDPSGKKVTSQCPMWLRLNKSSNQFELIPDRAKIIKDIYHKYISGMGRSSIAKHLTKSGVKPFGKAKIWHESYISKVLSEDYGRTTIGQYQPYKTVNGKRVKDGSPIEDYYPAVVSKSEFLRAQTIRKSKNRFSGGRKGSNFTNLFQGIIFCGNCDNSMLVVDKGVRSSGKSYTCIGKKAGNECTNFNYHLEMSEEAILFALHSIDFNQILSEKSDTDDLENQILHVKDELLENEKRKLALIKHLGMFKDDQVFANSYAELIQQSKFLEEQLADLETKQSEMKLTHEELPYLLAAVDKVLDRHEYTQSELYELRSKLALLIKNNVEKITFTKLKKNFGIIFLHLGGQVLQIHALHKDSVGVFCLTHQRAVKNSNKVEYFDTNRNGRDIVTYRKTIDMNLSMEEEIELHKRRNQENQQYMEARLNYSKKRLQKRTESD